jgi:hypothetical protein
MRLDQSKKTPIKKMASIPNIEQEFPEYKTSGF